MGIPSLIASNVTLLPSLATGQHASGCTEDEPDCDEYKPYNERPETYIVPFIFSIIFVVGVVGNGTLIVIFLRHRAMRNIPNTWVNKTFSTHCMALCSFIVWAYSLWCNLLWADAKSMTVAFRHTDLTLCFERNHFKVGNRKEERKNERKKRFNLPFCKNLFLFSLSLNFCKWNWCFRMQWSFSHISNQIIALNNDNWMLHFDCGMQL